MNMSHVFLHRVLAAIILVVGRTRDGGARARARCFFGFLLCSAASTSVLGGGSRAQVAGVTARRLGYMFVFSPLNVCSPHSPTLILLAQREAVLEQEGLSRCLAWVGTKRGWSRHQSEFQTIPELLPPQVPALCALTWLSSFVGLSRLSPATACSSSLRQSWSWGRAVLWSQWGWSWHSTRPRSTASSRGKQARVPGSFNLFALSYFRSKQVCAHSSRAESRFLTALL